MRESCDQGPFDGVETREAEEDQVRIVLAWSVPIDQLEALYLC